MGLKNVQELENTQTPEILSAKNQKIQTLKKFISETDRFVSRSIHTSKIDQVTHHQGDVRYGATSGIQYLCVSLIAGCWSLIKCM